MVMMSLVFKNMSLKLLTGKLIFFLKKAGRKSLSAYYVYCPQINKDSHIDKVLKEP